MSEAKEKVTEEKAAPVAAEAAGTEAGAATVRKKKTKRSVSAGNIYIQASFNNTIVTITDQMGNVVCWSTAGAKGFRGSRKNTPFAAQVAAEDASRKAVESGMRTVQVFVNGPG